MLDPFLFRRHLEDDEHIRMIVHKHWLIGIHFLVWPSLSFLAAWTLLALAGSQAAILLAALWSIGSAVWWLRNFFDYYLDAWIITDHGIIDLEWLGWFHRQSARILYSDIQGVSYEIHGILGTLLRYGVVTVEKISTGSTVSLTHVPRPRVVESAILQSMEAYLHGKNLKNAKHVEELLAQFVAGRVQEEDVRGAQSGGETSAEPAVRTSRPTKRSFTSSRIGASEDV